MLEFAYLKELNWEMTEKIDGMNIRVIWLRGEGFIFEGKTNEAELKPILIEKLASLFDHQHDKIVGMFGTSAAPICIYGEGIGNKINGSGRYGLDYNFIAFDIKVGETWLRRADVVDICDKLNLHYVPEITCDELEQMVNYCKYGFKSTYGDFEAEGLIATPMIPLRTRMGERIITKLKCCDFIKTDDQRSWKDF